MKRTNLLKWLNLCSLLAVVVVNALAMLLPIGGQTTEEISNKYINLFTPTGLTFSVWAVIYLLLIIGFLQIILSKKETFNELTGKISYWFIISCLLNIVWIFMWHYNEVLLSTIIIILLCITMYTLLSKVENNGIMFWAISIYTGWISIATIASFFVCMVYMGVNGTSTLSMIIVAIVIIGVSILMGCISRKLSNLPFGLVSLWAIIGILIRHISYFNSQYILIIVASIIGIIFLVYSLIKVQCLRMK